MAISSSTWNDNSDSSGATATASTSSNAHDNDHLPTSNDPDSMNDTTNNDPEPVNHRGPTIQFDDNAIRPVRSHGAVSTATGISMAGNQYGGVFPMRTRSRASSRGPYSRRRRPSLDGSRSVRSGTGDIEQAEDEDSGLRQAGDYKTKQVFTGTTLAWLSYQSIGVIYGDIGTSPLYVFSSTFTSPPSNADLVGILSMIIWTLLITVTLKYVVIILHADNEGEGGTFSTYSLLARYANITKRDPREASMVRMERFLSGDLEDANRHVRHGLERSAFARNLLKTIGVLAVSMVMSDGVLTPAQSVLGAVQGLNVVDPGLSNSTIVGTTCGILILLFMIQPLGTEKIAYAFSPIVCVWLAFNAAFGIYNLVTFDHGVLRAFSPHYAFLFLIRNKTDGWRMLGGVLLSFTGVEALFADLGAFSRRAIQLSWLCYTFPCLLLAYVGQAAFISEHPEAYTNPFFNAVPPGTLIPSVVIAVLAAIVASQAIITATFQLLAQIMKLSYFPQVQVVHTSKTFHGQLYIPLLNWLLMIGTVLIAAIYNNTTSLGNAYGVCVMFVTFFDTCMVSLVALIVWRIHPAIVFFPWLAISCLDGLYLSSALTKVPDGAWFTLTLATVLACLFILWRFGKEQQWAAEASDRFPTTHLVQNTKSGICLTPQFGGASISTVKGFGIFFDKAGETTPAVFTHFLSKLVAAPEVMVFFHLRPLEVPSVAPENRYHVSRLAIPNCYRLIVRHGFMDAVITPDLASLVLEQVRDFVIRQNVVMQKGPEEAVPSRGRAGWHSSAPMLLEAQTMENENEKDECEERAEKVEDRDDGGDAENTLTRTGTSFSTVTDPKQRLSNEAPRTPQKTITWDTRTAHPRSAQLPVGVDTDPSPSPDTTSPSDQKLIAELHHLSAAFAHQVLYIVGKEEMRVMATPKEAGWKTRVKGWWKRGLLEAFLWMRDNTRTRVASLGLPTERVVEVGFVKEVGGV